MTGDLEHTNRDSVEKAFVLMLSLFSAVLTAYCVSVIDVGHDPSTTKTDHNRY